MKLSNDKKVNPLEVLSDEDLALVPVPTEEECKVILKKMDELNLQLSYGFAYWPNYL